ncbi:uncharacterized protein LOC119672429 [Teleopsis dalmanni]|uniref:uncharacterized protein LOC119672429 n=1 Tax=Teleopsis dalmanni TaxID=139649 RepID=UPI000D329FCB|nr:uncharacterized protein LOC119672429 [Teleopsis dalmanni]
MDIRKELIGSYIVVCLKDNTKYYGQVKNFDNKSICLTNVVVNGKPYSYPESVKSISTDLIKSYEVLDLTEGKIREFRTKEKNAKFAVSDSHEADDKSARIKLNMKSFVASYDEKWQQMFPKQYEEKKRAMETARSNPKHCYFGINDPNVELKPIWSSSVLLSNGLIYQALPKCKPTGVSNIFDCLRKYTEPGKSEERLPFFNPFKYKPLDLVNNECDDQIATEEQDSGNASVTNEQKEFDFMLTKLRTMGCNTKTLLDDETIKEAYDNILAEKKQAMLKAQNEKDNMAKCSAASLGMRPEMFETKTGFTIPAIRLAERTEIVTLMNRSLRNDNVNTLISHCIFRSLLEVWKCNENNVKQYPDVVVLCAANADANEICEKLVNLLYKKTNIWVVNEAQMTNKNSYRDCVKNFYNHDIDFVVICLHPMCSIKWIQNLEYWFKDLDISMFLIDPPVNYKPLAPRCIIYGLVPVLPLIGFNPKNYDELFLCNLCISDQIINNVVGCYENPFDDNIFVPLVDAIRMDKKTE